MPPEHNINTAETAPLLPPQPADPEASSGQTEDGSKASTSFLPVIALLIFGVVAGWLIGHYNGSLLWIIPAIAIISGITHRRIAHFKKYLLHAILRTGDKERVAR